VLLAGIQWMPDNPDESGRALQIWDFIVSGNNNVPKVGIFEQTLISGCPKKRF